MMFFDNVKNTINQPLGEINGYSIFIKREDLLHPVVSGNKYRKLKYIFKNQGSLEISQIKIKQTNQTFGGGRYPKSNRVQRLARLAAESNVDNVIVGGLRAFEQRNSTGISFANFTNSVNVEKKKNAKGNKRKIKKTNKIVTPKKREIATPETGKHVKPRRQKRRKTRNRDARS